MPYRFGALQRPSCPHCSGEMMVTRRSPAQGLEMTHEKQIMTCLKCGHEKSRIVNEEGIESV